MNKLTLIIILACNACFLSTIGLQGTGTPKEKSSYQNRAIANVDPLVASRISNLDQAQRDAYQRGLEKVAATESMKQLHANYAELGSPFKEMTTVQFADLFHRSQGFTLPGTREVSYNMYLQGWSSEIPALADPEPDDCTPEEIEAWYRKFYDPWNARRPAPSPWARELPFVDPQPYHLVQPGFTVVGGRGYRWGIVLTQNAHGDYETIGQLKPDYKPEINASGK